MATDPEIIRIAVQRYADHIRTSGDDSPSELPHHPTAEERASRKAAIAELCDQMELLGKRSVTEDVRFPEFEDLCHRLAKLGAKATKEEAGAVAVAFMLAGRLDGKP